MKNIIIYNYENIQTKVHNVTPAVTNESFNTEIFFIPART